MIRRFGDAKARNQRYSVRPGAYAVLSLGTNLLLTYQSQPEPEIQLPGGGIEPGESPVAALHREVFEETGWRIARPRRLGVFRRFTFMPEYDLWAEKICHIFLARPVLRHGPPQEKFHTAIWVPSREAGQLLANDGDRHFVSRLFR